MFPSSLAVILTGLAVALIALGGFVWGWRAGAFRHLDAQSRIILDERDLRLARPWESSAQSAARQATHGPPIEPMPGEWGDAQRKSNGGAA